jgi:hypothetical protein
MDGTDLPHATRPYGLHRIRPALRASCHAPMPHTARRQRLAPHARARASHRAPPSPHQLASIGQLVDEHMLQPYVMRFQMYVAYV